ncbi:DUF192 domain-containing protein [Natronorarus salvus]|uniref:DUF192 domain-containing protein n=1 Tax=Natronorarus salvus TaxID=3117733 RepID=UPI002F264619
MKLLHERAGRPRTLATRVELADTFSSRAKGLMFRRRFEEGAALVFRFPESRVRAIHMVCVPFALDVCWLERGEVVRIERLRPWIGFARERARTVVELPAGATEGVEPGDSLRLVPDSQDPPERTG